MRPGGGGSEACWLEATVGTAAEDEPLRLRLDEDYWLTQTTTLGPVTVPLFAYRDANGKTQEPAREVVFRLHPLCRSSELCLEWENRLGSQLPFRQAEDAMAFFTHGAAPVEDTTIARHLVAIGSSISREWTFRSPEEIRNILANRATRDLENGKPLLYVSTDAHALRRYVDETWQAPWKMNNGIAGRGFKRARAGHSFPRSRCDWPRDRSFVAVREGVSSKSQVPSFLDPGLESTWRYTSTLLHRPTDRLTRRGVGRLWSQRQR